MMKCEFEQIAGYEVTTEDYNNIIEPMYMSTNLDKYEFAKVIDRKRFEKKIEKSDETIRIEAEMKERIETAKDKIEVYKSEYDRYMMYFDMDGDKEWKRLAKLQKRYIQEQKAEIYNCKFVLGC